METSEPKRQATCKERIGQHLTGRIADIRKLWKAYQSGQEETDEGSIYDYGLSFDYVPAKTFNGQRVGYWRWQISWGGPSDEFRFYTDGERNLTRIEYRFMDWFDGAGRTLRGTRRALLEELWTWFDDCGSVQAEFDKAMQE